MTTRDPGLPAGPCPVNRLATVGGVWAAAFGAAYARQHLDHFAAGRGGEETQADEDCWAEDAATIADAAVAAFERMRGGSR